MQAQTCLARAFRAMAVLLFYKSLLCAYLFAAQVLLSLSLCAVPVKELAVVAEAYVAGSA